jgi:hypothetical protein
MLKGWKVNVWEFERGWGSKIDFVETFKANEFDKAEKFVKDFNSENTEKIVPDWYMMADAPVPIMEK